MKKIVALLMLVLAIGAAPMVSSADECTDLEGNRACTTDTGVALDGDADNPDPLDGWITVDLENGGGCASDDGNYDDEDAEGTCV